MTNKNQKRELKNPSIKKWETEGKIPQWKRELFPQTWNLELMLSSISIFALIHLPELLEQGYLSLKQLDLSWFGGYLYIFYIFLVLSSKALLYIFIFHLILRGIWVGMIGLNSVFLQGVQLNKLKYSNLFNAKLQKNASNLEETTTNLNNICSIIFPFSFLFVFFLLSTCIWLVLTCSLLLISINNYLYVSFICIYFLASAIYFLDYITFGILKKDEKISRIYYPIYWFFSKVTLSFLYRPIYYAFISNVSKVKYLTSFSAYFLIIFLLNYNQIASDLHLPKIGSNGGLFIENISSPEYLIDNYFYEDTKPALSYITIQSYIIKDNFLRITIRYNNKIDDESIKKVCPQWIKLFKETNKKIRSKIVIDCFSSYYHIYINGSLYQNIHFAYDYKRKVVIAYIPISNLPTGYNMLKFCVNRCDLDINESIPFIIDREK